MPSPSVHSGFPISAEGAVESATEIFMVYMLLVKHMLIPDESSNVGCDT